MWRELFEGDPPPKFSAADEFGTWAAAVLAEKPPVGLSQNGSERTTRRKIPGAQSREPATQALTTEVLTTTASFTRHRLTGPDQSCTKPTGWYVAPTGHLAAAYLTLHAPTGHLAAAYLILHTILHTFIHACARGCTRSFTVVCAFRCTAQCLQQQEDKARNCCSTGCCSSSSSFTMARDEAGGRGKSVPPGAAPNQGSAAPPTPLPPTRSSWSPALTRKSLGPPIYRSLHGDQAIAQQPRTAAEFWSAHSRNGL